jgi:endonuclease/exonuclease/phosphatase family metal-dependent hydrolase
MVKSRMPDWITLVSFNILEGFRPMTPVAAERRQLDRERADAARALVAALAPDILVLNEALFCRHHDGKAVDYGALFDFPYQVCALYDGAWGNAILSRFPVVQSSEMRIYNRGGLTAVIDAPTGRLTVASYHPHPARYPENKALDFDRMVAGHPAGGQRDQAEPLIVCGDLNCINPADAIDRERLVEAFRRFAPDAESAVDRLIESGRQVFDTLGELGLHDAVPLAGRHYSIPTDLLSLDKRSAVRIDHILANEAIEILDGAVVHSPESNRASDHHPVFVRFRLRSAGAA